VKEDLGIKRDKLGLKKFIVPISEIVMQTYNHRKLVYLIKSLFLQLPSYAETMIDRLKNAIITVLLPYWSFEKVNQSTNTEGIYQFSSNLTFKEDQKLDVTISQLGVNNKFEDIPSPYWLSLPSSRFSSAILSAYKNQLICKYLMYFVLEVV